MELATKSPTASNRVSSSLSTSSPYVNSLERLAEVRILSVVTHRSAKRSSLVSCLVGDDVVGCCVTDGSSAPRSLRLPPKLIEVDVVS